ncbi:MAG: hypothetical protein GY788_14745 [bacterium]|nr:hypothetical protein [bacterium]
MTTLNVHLSDQLEATLGVAGVWAYAVYFDGSPVWAPLVENGVVQSSGDVAIPLPAQLSGGKVYFLVQSQAISQPHNLHNLITKESEINWGNASDWDFRYDSFEVTLKNGPDDDGNLTSVNGFGLPMELSVTYDTGETDTRGYGVTANDLFDKLKNVGNGEVVFDFNDGPLKDAPREAISPSEAVGLNSADVPFKASDWDAYITALQKTDLGIELAGFFNGAADANGVWHNAGFYSYALEWDSKEKAFWLSPAENSEIQGYIKITPDDLANSIYSTLGNVGIYTSKADTEPYKIFKHAPYNSGDYSMNSGENNQWGEVLTQLLTGFTAGFYETSGKPINPKATTAIDLGKNWNWDPTYAFGKNLDGPPAPFHDAYSSVFFFESNSYGSGYSDDLMEHYAVGGPLISVSQPDGTKRNVDEINMTIFDDGETPTGYETPVIYNHIAPDANGYQQPDSTTTTNSIKLSFANSEIVLADDTPISFDIYEGEDPSGAAIWHTVAFTANGASPWQVWKLTKGSGGYAAVLQDNTPQGAGQLLITNVPTSGTDGVYWYRLNVGTGDDLKSFNLYAEMSEANGQQEFVNPNFTGQQGSLAIDGLATIAPEVSKSKKTITTFTIDFLYSEAVATDPDLLVRDPAKSDHGTPNAPVAGTLSVGKFDALGGQSNQVSNTVSTSEAQIAFGWTGLNDSTVNSASWIFGHTNKTGALNFAEVSFSRDGASALAPITATADIDGQWQTAAQHLGNGTYTVTMTEYLSGDPALKTPVGGQSSPLKLTVDVAETELANAGGGDALALVLDGKDDPPGNWIRLEAIASSVPAGTTLLLYATNAQGDLVSRDGHESGPHVTLEQATRGTIGAVHADGGALLLHGSQAIYLEAGLHLRFAVVRGNEIVDDDPDVKIDTLKDGRLKVTVDDFVLQAETDNDLSATEMLGGTQRSTNEALLHLEHGATLEIDLVGSCGNTNTLAFVLKDIDPATGAWSVNGVAYSDTKAFKDAVVANLDAGFLYSNGGRFDDTVSWTVAGESGFYAPVLLTQNGDVFVIGDANAGGHDYIRMYGHNTFGFEDLAHDQGSDFDYNDMVMHITPVARDNLGEADLFL